MENPTPPTTDEVSESAATENKSEEKSPPKNDHEISTCWHKQRRKRKKSRKHSNSFFPSPKMKTLLNFQDAMNRNQHKNLPKPPPARSAGSWQRKRNFGIRGYN